MLRLRLSTILHTQTFPSVRPASWDDTTPLRGQEPAPGLWGHHTAVVGGRRGAEGLAALRTTLVPPASDPPI